MRIADQIFRVVERHVDTVFLVPGGGAGFLVDALGQSHLRVVSMLHEQGAGFAACGYAQYRGLGVCLVTTGPGVSNALTPCLTAWVDSIPVLFISGQVAQDQMRLPDQRSRGTQEGPTIALVEAITKYRIMLHSTDLVMTIVESLIQGAREDRPGPVWLDVPMNIQSAEAP